MNHAKMIVFCRMRRLAGLVLGMGLVLGLGQQARAAGPYVDLGPADAFAVDQPRIQLHMVDQNTGTDLGPGGSVLLDTAANGILVGQLGYLVAELSGTDFQQATHEGQPVFYEELGVAGTSALQVLKPYDVTLIDSTGQSFYHFDTVAMGSEQLSFGSFAAIAGMPLMQGHVIKMDLRALADLGNTLGGDLDDLLNAFDPFIDVEFADTMPAPTADTYTVPLVKMPIEYVDDPPVLPDYAPIPMVEGLKLKVGNQTISSTMPVDTGAQTMVITRNTALSLGFTADQLDPFNPDVTTLPIGGVGDGTVEAPIVLLDELVMPTDQGVDLVFRDIETVVVDIEGLDGVVGMNILSTGYIEPFIAAISAMFDGSLNDLIFSAESSDDIDASQLLASEWGYGAFEQVTFDFASEDWSMALAMNPDANQVVPEPATLALLLIGGSWVGFKRRTR